MTLRDECRVVAELLARFEAADESLRAVDAETIVGHLESCPECGMAEAAAQRIVEGVRGMEAPLPDDAFFENNAAQIMASVLAEPAEATHRPAPRVVGIGERAGARSPARAPRRMRLVGGALAAAAAIAVFVTGFVLGNHPTSSPGVADVPIGARPTQVVSVEGIEIEELVASDDAWLVASYDIFDLDLADVNGGLQVEDLSDEELDALEGMFGSAPSLG